MDTLDLPVLIIRYNGIFDFNGLYNLIANWMKARRFWFKERSYKHKVPSPSGAEQEIDFIGDKKVTEFYSQQIKMNLHLWDMTEIEVVQGGVTKKLTNARIEITIACSVTVDYEKRWEESKFRKFLFHIYRQYMKKEEIDNYADQLYFRVYKLHNEIKEFLDMQAKGNIYERYMGPSA